MVSSKILEEPPAASSQEVLQRVQPVAEKSKCVSASCAPFHPRCQNDRLGAAGVILCKTRMTDKLGTAFLHKHAWADTHFLHVQVVCW